MWAIELMKQKLKTFLKIFQKSVDNLKNLLYYINIEKRNEEKTMKIIGTFKTALGTETTYGFQANDVLHAEERAQEIAKAFGWTLLTWN